MRIAIIFGRFTIQLKTELMQQYCVDGILIVPIYLYAFIALASQFVIVLLPQQYRARN